MDEGYDHLEPSFSIGAALVGNVSDIDDLCQKYLGNMDKASDHSHHPSPAPTDAHTRAPHGHGRHLMEWQGKEVERWAREVLRQQGFDDYGVDLSVLQTLSGRQLLRLSHHDLCGLVGRQWAAILHHQLNVLKATQGGSSPTTTVGDSGSRSHTHPASDCDNWEASASTQHSYDWRNSDSYYSTDDTRPSTSRHTAGGWGECVSFNRSHVDAYSESLESSSHWAPGSFHAPVPWKPSTSMYSSSNFRQESYHSLDDYTSGSYPFTEGCMPSISQDSTREWTAPESCNISQAKGQPRQKVEVFGKITPRTTRRRKHLEESDPLVGNLRSLELQEPQEATSDEEEEEEERALGGPSSDTAGGVVLSYPEVLKKIPSRTRKRVRGPKSWEFLIRLLVDKRTNPSLVRWEDEATATFRLMQPGIIAQMWVKRSSDKSHLSYNNFARGLRYHYSTGALEPVSERQLVYRCGPSALEYLKELREQS